MKFLSTVGLSVLAACSTVEDKIPPYNNCYSSLEVWQGNHQEWGETTLAIGRRNFSPEVVYGLEFASFFTAPFPFTRYALKDWEGDGVCDEGKYDDLLTLKSWPQAGRGRLSPSLRKMEKVLYEALDLRNQGFKRIR